MRRSITDKLGRHVSGWRIKDGGGEGGVSVRGREKVGRKEERHKVAVVKCERETGYPVVKI